MPNHPTPVILSSEQVAEIEAANQGCRYPYVDALCATVRALRAVESDLRKSVEEWVTHYNEVEKWRSDLSVKNTALREQLAQVEKEQYKQCSTCADCGRISWHREEQP